MARLRRVVYASDFSTASRRAFATALNLAKTNRAALTVVHVLLPIMMVSDMTVSPSVWEEIRRGTRRWAEQHLSRLATKAKIAGVRATARLLEGDPAEQIVRAAHAAHADVIVVGTHGRKGVPRFFIGSVAERVVRSASCPVMTVRGA